MKTLTSREISRRPSVLTKIAPGEVVPIADRKGGLVITRQKTTRLTAQEMIAALDALAPQCPPLDVDKILKDEE